MTQTTVHPPGATGPAPRAPRWIPFLPLPRGPAWGVYRLARFAAGATGVCSGLLAAAAIGILPFLLSYALGLPGHQTVSAILLALLTLGFVLNDRWIRGILAIALAFAVHSSLVIALSRADPQRCAAIVPGGEDYWQKQEYWIRTGIDPEYNLAYWLPAHFMHAGAAVLFSYTSMGAAIFHHGFYEVDLMNYYNARLGSLSTNPPLAFILGWHIWSILRGLGYLFITFEVISFSFARLTGLAVSTARHRRLRWACGLGLLVADGVAKWLLLDWVRGGLRGVLA